MVMRRVRLWMMSVFAMTPVARMVMIFSCWRPRLAGRSMATTTMASLIVIVVDRTFPGGRADHGTLASIVGTCRGPF